MHIFPSNTFRINIEEIVFSCTNVDAGATGKWTLLKRKRDKTRGHITNSISIKGGTIELCSVPKHQRSNNFISYSENVRLTTLTTILCRYQRLSFRKRQLSRRHIFLMEYGHTLK